MFSTDEIRSEPISVVNCSYGVAQMNKKQGGWFKLRSLVSFHTDTLCDRIAP